MLMITCCIAKDVDEDLFCARTDKLSERTS